jgi:hypothetical protein
MEAIYSCETLGSLRTTRRYATQQLDWQTRDCWIFAKQLKAKYSCSTWRCWQRRVPSLNIWQPGYVSRPSCVGAYGVASRYLLNILNIILDGPEKSICLCDRILANSVYVVLCVDKHTEETFCICVWISRRLVIVESIVAYGKPLLRNDREMNETTAVARQRFARNNESTVGSGVFCVVRAEAMNRPSSVQFS